jgi:hypothetical protein
MRLWWWRKIRHANIPQEDRDIFERYGVMVITGILMSGHSPHIADLHILQSDQKKQYNALIWLTEQSDAHEQREQRLETVDWTIFIFVVIGVIVDCLLIFKSRA